MSFVEGVKDTQMHMRDNALTLSSSTSEYNGIVYRYVKPTIMPKNNLIWNYGVRNKLAYEVVV